MTVKGYQWGPQLKKILTKMQMVLSLDRLVVDGFLLLLPALN